MKIEQEIDIATHTLIVTKLSIDKFNSKENIVASIKCENIVVTNPMFC